MDKSNFTIEKYEEIKKDLENENLDKFPSIFQQARNLAKQAWVSGTGVLSGKALLANADKAYKRLEICNTCEFFKENRCLKCGCYMDKKIHLELSRCPINKWGPALQELMPQQSPQDNNKNSNIKRPEIKSAFNNDVPSIELEKFPLEDQQNIKKLAEKSLFQYDGRFSYKEIEYQALFKRNAPTQYFIYEIPPKNGKRNFLESMSQDKRIDLLNTAKKFIKAESPVEFEFDNVVYRVTLRLDKKINISIVKEIS